MSDFFNHLFREYWMDQRINQVNQSVFVQRRLAAKASQKQTQQNQDVAESIEDLEADLGRMALLVRVLLDACIQKGVVTHDELSRMIGEIDMLDGVQDGRLDPKKARPTKGS